MTLKKRIFTILRGLAILQANIKHMKALTLISALLLFCHIGYGQILVENNKMYSEEDSIKEVKQKNQNQPETLFKSQSSFGGYLGLSFGYTEINGKAALNTGGRLMFVANHYLGIGFGGKGFITSPEESIYNGDNPNITTIYTATTGGYGGLYLEPVLFSLKPIHLSFPVLIGAGAMAESKWNNTTWNDYYYTTGNTTVSSVFFVAEPGVDLEFNIAKWFRIGLGASYRITSNVEGLTETTAEPQNGFNYNMTFKMGWF